MKFNRKNAIKLLDNLEFQELLIEQLGWNYCDDKTPVNIPVHDQVYT